MAAVADGGTPTPDPLPDPSDSLPMLQPLIDYLQIMVPTALGGDPQVFAECVGQSDAVRAFCTQSPVLYVTSHTPTQQQDQQLQKPVTDYTLSLAAPTPGLGGLTMCFAKKDAVNAQPTALADAPEDGADASASAGTSSRVEAALDPSVMMGAQLLCMSLGPDKPTDTLFTLLDASFDPLVTSYLKANTSKSPLDATAAAAVTSSMSSLKVALSHVRQEVDIPAVDLVVHPVIVEVLAKCASTGKRMEVTDLGSTAKDPQFLDELQDYAAQWIVEIHKVTLLERDSSSGTALQEINFWLAKEAACLAIADRLKQPGIVMTMETLKFAKRYQATVSFEPDTKLNTAMQQVNSNNLLMKEFPMTPLLTAAELPAVIDALELIFAHLKKVRNTAYPLIRALHLVEALSRDLNERMLDILHSRRLLFIPYDEFSELMAQAREVFDLWDDLVTEYKGTIREVARLRRNPDEQRLPIRVTKEHQALQERVATLAEFRSNHHDLRGYIRSVTPSVASLDAAVELAHSLMDVFDAARSLMRPLDLSPPGQVTVDDAMGVYEAGIKSVERTLNDALAKALDKASSSNAMYRYFAKFTALARLRPDIQATLDAAKPKFLDAVRNDVDGLRSTFGATPYPGSSTHDVCSVVHDIPPVSGHILYASQFVKALARHRRRLDDVLGPDWPTTSDAGPELASTLDAFAAELDTDKVLASWVDKVTAAGFTASGRVLDVSGPPSDMALRVTFDPESASFVREYEFLVNVLHLSLPESLAEGADTIARVHVYAASMANSLADYAAASDLLPDTLVPLLAVARLHVHTVLAKAFNLKWEAGATRLGLFAGDLAAAVAAYQGSVNTLVAAYNGTIVPALEALATVPLSWVHLFDTLKSVQDALNDLLPQGFTNMSAFVGELNARAEAALAKRLETAIELWIDAFRSPHIVALLEGSVSAADAPPAFAPVLNSEYPVLELMEPMLHILNQQVFIEPTLEDVRSDLSYQFNSWVTLFTNLPAFSAGVVVWEPEQGNWPIHKAMLPSIPASLVRWAYDAIEDALADMTRFVDSWLCYQTLWDLNVGSLLRSLGSNYASWRAVLDGVAAHARAFDSVPSSAVFGSIRVTTSQATSKISGKYSDLLRELAQGAARSLVADQAAFITKLSDARASLEAVDLADANTVAALETVLNVQTLRRGLRAWSATVKSFTATHSTVEALGFAATLAEQPGYTSPAQLSGEWSAFTQALNRKASEIAAAGADLHAGVAQLSKAYKAELAELAASWADAKPSPDAKPSDALGVLDEFQSRINELRAKFGALNAGREALDLEEVSPESVLVPLESEVDELAHVWSALDSVVTTLDGYRSAPWSTILPKKLRKVLDSLTDELNGMPNKVKSFQPWMRTSRTLMTYTAAMPLVDALHTDSLKDRHWRELAGLLGEPAASWPRHAKDLTLGHVWAVDLLAHERTFRSVLTIAQGEMGLEEFLRQVKEFWSETVFDTVVYQGGKTHLIRGWDEIFNKLMEHLNSLASMRASPYYKVFEDEASLWESRLNAYRDTLDVWLDVQRRWIYLEGIFTGSADIRVLLPKESSKFKAINTEFLGLMKRTAKAPEFLDVMASEDLDPALRRLADHLTTVQKALGEYLERQRSSFPRFYFVGDDDLLEIIGNSKDLSKIIKHLKKMFAGVAGLELDPEDDTVITALVSGQGEVVPLATPVATTTFKRINDWLMALEAEMKTSLALCLSDAVAQLDDTVSPGKDLDPEAYFAWVSAYPDQIVTLASQCTWTAAMEAALASDAPGPAMDTTLQLVLAILAILAGAVLGNHDANTRKKYEHLITELVHQRDTIRKLIAAGVASPLAFGWLGEMRYYFDGSVETPTDRFVIRMANAQFGYGWEYLGVQSKLVTTPLTDQCYLTLTQALDQRMGGSPFGPAGTGKTESVKALGSQLGRFVLVFCCDENFDFQAMGRIFVGLCQVGAWGCFDEFNRLAERMLSAVSQQIQTIQLALQAGITQVELLGSTVPISTDMGIFITMNPGYAGRSNLPDNLKQLFRPMAMTAPDKELIGQVMLYSQGFASAERLAGKVVPLFKLCSEQLSDQSHYDFGLRSLKSVLVSAGNIKRGRLLSGADPVEWDGGPEAFEQDVLLQSICETLIPKLVAPDIPLLHSLLSDVFPSSSIPSPELDDLRAAIQDVARESHFVAGPLWVDKMLQLYSILNLNHGVMLVGPSGSGKSSAWRTLLAALERVEGVEGVSYVVDPKAIAKDDLYGFLDPTTREWTDGLMTGILRRIIDNVRGDEDAKRHWIIFDGDVDPEWVENMNSLLDDNKLLTLPNGERLALPSNVRIMFEVQDLKYATLATVSRTGMVWFSENTLTTSMILQEYLLRLRAVPVAGDYPYSRGDVAVAQDVSTLLAVQAAVADVLAPHFADGDDTLVHKALAYAESETDQVMDFTRLRVLGAVFSLLDMGVASVHAYNGDHADFPLKPEIRDAYMRAKLLYALVWGLSGAAKIATRAAFSDWLSCEVVSEEFVFPPSGPIIDYEVDIKTGTWALWNNKVPRVEVEPSTMGNTVIQTLDTVRHVDVLAAWMAQHKPLLLCGPPGSGKTMTLFSTLRNAPNYEVCPINFSSATSPELILSTFEQKCTLTRRAQGLVLHPTEPDKWIVVFCDEINLPEPDDYGTQAVITFLRQLVELNGYWQPLEMQWVTLERIQFVGACNPPTDPGRTPLTHRFLRHAPLVLCDYPAYESLMQIYGTFARALLGGYPNLAPAWEPFTHCMVEFYTLSQSRFTPEAQQHYIYSPRELTRWVRGVYDALVAGPVQGAAVELEALMRIWAHEGLRLFQDRLVTPAEAAWTDEHLAAVAHKHMDAVMGPERVDAALTRPILYSSWLSKYYESVDREELRAFVRAKMRVFCEEELDVRLVLFDEVLDHILRIDRVFHQKQGHLLQIGQSGAGKTVLSRFVAWMNGISVFTIRGSASYTGADFDADLRTVLFRSGAQAERLCFIFDESNIKDTGFLERMNTLLANGEIPGLFEGEEWTGLMAEIRTTAEAMGEMLESEDELYEWFTGQIIRNLHVVFTMNPAGGGFENRTSTSPALFNRCVLNWFGDWSAEALHVVGLEFTAGLDLEDDSYTAPSPFPTASVVAIPDGGIDFRHAVVNAMVGFHSAVDDANGRLALVQGRFNYVTPRHYLDFIAHYVRLFDEIRGGLEKQQRHLLNGLNKLVETEASVMALQGSLAETKELLTAKNAEAEAKLKQMVIDQQEAEVSKVDSEKIAVQVEAKLVEVEAQRKVALADLQSAEPMVRSAEAAVKGIKKSHLDEVRALANPPSKIKKTMEAVASLLGAKDLSWKAIKKLMAGRTFISDIISFDAESIEGRLRASLMAKYLDDPEFVPEIINKASKACGPLCKWFRAILQYSDILHRVEPLRAELAKYEAECDELVARQAEVDATLATLEASIARYKEEYSALIAETQRISAAMDETAVKVDRSRRLLDSLSTEKVRWSAEADGFEVQIASSRGDVLLGAAMLAYGGYFDQASRAGLLRAWQRLLGRAGIPVKPGLDLNELLATPADELAWQGDGLPVDALATQNAVMITSHNRYPLLIDPSGQGVAFLMALHAKARIVKSSFLDPNFLKHMEAALRFGTPILVQDVEEVDPVINPVLNKEVRKVGGRILVQLGEADIDYSPSFKLFLSTRDPTFNFAPDLCSRVTFVNFTVTPGSLQSQCLSRVLKHERPDVDAKRSDLLKAQGEFRVALRGMESQLLTTLSESEGNILENDAVVTTLEKIKADAAEISAKSAEADGVMAEVEEVSALYTPMAASCSAVYFCLQGLGSLRVLYQYSLAFFLDVFDVVLGTEADDADDASSRLSLLLDTLFKTVFERVSPGLLNDDVLVLALELAKLRLAAGGSPVPSDLAAAFSPKTVTDVDEEVAALARSVACLSDRLSGSWRSEAAAWARLRDNLDVRAEDEIPSGAVGGLEPAGLAAFGELAVVQVVRPDRVLGGVRRCVSAVFGREFLEAAPLDLERVVMTEVKAGTPLLMVSLPGHDASSKVDELVAARGVRCTSIAIGSPSGYGLAETAIASAAKGGTWVLLKNVHLAPQWLVRVERLVHGLSPKDSFRLFMTGEIHDGLPVNLLRMSRVFVFEPPPGVKANLRRSLGSIESERLNAEPRQRGQLYFLVAWLHATLQERLGYIPLGWAQSYEFNDADMRSALASVDYWIATTEDAARDIPWAALHTLLSTCVYGGRIDNDFDGRLLTSFVDSLFSYETLNGGMLVPAGTPGLANGLAFPNQAGSWADYAEWVNALPDTQTPAWLGLPANAENVVLAVRGNTLASKVRKLATVSGDDGDDDDSAGGGDGAGGDGDGAGASGSGGSDAPAWMRELSESCKAWRSGLASRAPDGELERVLEAASGSGSGSGETASMLNPLFRALEREVQRAIALRKIVLRDLDDVVAYTAGDIKLTNYIRSIVGALVRAAIPAEWVVYPVADTMAVGAFLGDLGDRLGQLLELVGAGNGYGKDGVVLGLLFSPEAYITASRQYAAQSQSWPLEELELRVVPGGVSRGDDQAFSINGLVAENAAWKNGAGLLLSDKPRTTMPTTVFRWERRGSPESNSAPSSVARVPMYLNSTRKHVLLEVHLPIPEGECEGGYYQCGVAIIAQ